VGQPQDHQAGDADLVRAALGGAREPFAELVRRHQRTATALAARVLGSDDLARDAVQEAAVTAMTGLDRLRSADRFGPWFCGIALNVSRRWLRQLRAERPDPDPDRARAGADGTAGVSTGAGPDELAELADIADRVRAAIAELADGQRDAVFLFYLQGLSHREVAAELGVSVGAVKSRLHQARAALAPRLAPLVDIQEETAVTATTSAPEWIAARVADVRRTDGDPATRMHVMVLELADGQGQLPIWIGPAEAAALALTLEAVETPRPMTYQLAASLVSALSGSVTEVRVVRLSENTFISEVVLEGPSGATVVDARPSDAISLGLLMGAPVRASDELLEQWGPTYEQVDLETYPDDANAIRAELGSPAFPASLDRLSEDAAEVLAQARQEAHRRSHAAVGTGHILLALLRRGTLRGGGFGVTVPAAENALEAETSLAQAQSAPPLTPRSLHVLMGAGRRAQSRPDPRATADDILAALLDEPGGLAARLMDDSAVDRDAVRAGLGKP
jgi:RNA polymerase sigma factor (sigma-70 family)